MSHATWPCMPIQLISSKGNINLAYVEGHHVSRWRFFNIEIFPLIMEALNEKKQ